MAVVVWRPSNRSTILNMIARVLQVSQQDTIWCEVARPQGEAGGPRLPVVGSCAVCAQAGLRVTCLRDLSTFMAQSQLEKSDYQPPYVWVTRFSSAAKYPFFLVVPLQQQSETAAAVAS